MTVIILLPKNSWSSLCSCLGSCFLVLVLVLDYVHVHVPVHVHVKCSS
jgi:hypothetical protein